MNVGNAVSSATKGATGATKAATTAENAATNTAANTTENAATNGANAMPGSDILSNVSNSLMVDKNAENAKLDQELKDANGGEEPNLKSGTKVDTGKAINSEGKVDDSSTKKVLTAAGRGAAAYFSGGKSLGVDNQVASLKPVDKTIGVVSDTLDKVPGVEAVTKELDDAGLADGVNDTLDVIGKAESGDIKGTIDSAKKIKKDGKKFKKYLLKKIAIILIPFLFVFFLVVIFVVVIAGPVIGGALDLVEDIGERAAVIAEQVKAGIFGEEEEEATINYASEIENFDELNTNRQNIVSWALAGLSANIKYKWGNKPTSAGLDGVPSDGLDCSGFVMWVYWSALGTKPDFSSTGRISELVGSQFEEIEESELQPGDIGLLSFGGSDNHTGIYVGNGQWVHDTGGNIKQVTRGSFNFKKFVRYKGID